MGDRFLEGDQDEDLEQGEGDNDQNQGEEEDTADDVNEIRGVATAAVLAEREAGDEEA